MTTLVIRLQVKPEKEDRFLEVINEIVGSMKGNEPQTRVYAFWKTKTPYEYFMLESYTTASALQHHIGRHSAFQEEFATFLSSPSKIEELGEFVIGYPDEGTLPLA